MTLVSFVSAHAMALVLGYMVFMIGVGVLPPLGPNAGYWAKFLMGFAQALALNGRAAFQLFNLKVPPLGAGAAPSDGGAVDKGKDG